MSYKSNSIKSGDSFKPSDYLKRSASSEEKVKLAGEESKDRLYEPKRDKKSVRVLTVVVYVFSVSLAAIILSLYYVFFWEPTGPQYAALRKTTLARSQVTSSTTRSARPCTRAHEPPLHPVVTPRDTSLDASMDSFPHFDLQNDTETTTDQFSNLTSSPTETTEPFPPSEPSMEPTVLDSEIRREKTDLLFSKLTGNRNRKRPNDTR